MIKKETRKDIIDHLEMEGIHWSGRLNDLEFLERLYDLSQLPSNDSRFKDARGDIWQHTVNNSDFEGYWVFQDNRFNLLSGPEKDFLKFLCEMVHPLVRGSSDEAIKIVSIVNSWLKRDNWELYETERRGNKPFFQARKLKSSSAEEKYRVTDRVPNQGGMGFVAFAEEIKTSKKVVIKFFKEDGTAEDKHRFVREVRLLLKYRDSGFTIPILDFSLDDDIPYFVMPRAESDLTKFVGASLEDKEKILFRMLDCVEYIHKSGDLHRDIKPENFLVLDNTVYISDLGLAKDPSSSTQFTQSVHAGGTPVYSPPNFFQYGGFKNPQIQDDLFSLGKAIYFIVTGTVPHYILQGNVPPPIYEVIKKATQVELESRYSSCAEMRSDLMSAFDIALSRGDAQLEYNSMKRDITKLNDEKFEIFLHHLASKEPEEKIKIFEKHSSHLFERISISKKLGGLASMLIATYRDIEQYISKQRYWPFSYAEKVARDASQLFASSMISVSDKAASLDLALNFAIDMHRSAAGETCARMIESISDDALAMACIIVLNKFESEFIFTHCINIDSCQHAQIIKTVSKKAKVN